LEQFEIAGGYAYKQRIRHVLAGLGFDEADSHRPLAQLSGGERTRALLARLLLEEPDLLLLDEPTSHLDLAGVEWLEGYLQAWKGSVLVVAHDRAFLDAVVVRVWDLAWGQMARYRGNYSAYVTQRAARLARKQTEYEVQRGSVAKTEDFIRRNIAGQRSREAKGRQKRLARLEQIVPAREYRPMRLSLGDVVRSGDLVLGLYNLAVGYDQGAPLLTVEELELRRGQRVAVLGPNGSGKTTLLRTVLGEVPPLAGRARIGANVHTGYLVQGYTNLAPDKTALETILDADEPVVSRARNLLGRYHFSGDDVFKRVGDLSGGEQARLALAVLGLAGANLLLLDEPTNHLDIPSQEMLQEVLSDFAGTLLMVTHDRYLIRGMSACIWAVADGRLIEFKEGYEAFRNWEMQRRVKTQGARETHRRTARERERNARKAAQREAQRQARRQIELEQTIRRLESRLEHLEQQLTVASEQQAVERVHRLGTEYGQIKEQLDAVLVTWTDLGE
jgi:ATP-binding cassette subfamily F protein 3